MLLVGIIAKQREFVKWTRGEVEESVLNYLKISHFFKVVVALKSEIKNAERACFFYDDSLY